jgi:predicted RNA-binding protein with PIN domain
MFLVDGYNVIRRTPSLHGAERGGGLAAGRRALLATLAASGVLRSSRVMVVFDAREEVAAPPEPSPHPMLSVRFSTPPQDADAAILALLRGASEKSRTGVTVVTADRELAWEVHRLGARVVSPPEWEPLRTKRSGRPRGKGRKERSDKPHSSPADVAYWLGVFGDGGKD